MYVIDLLILCHFFFQFVSVNINLVKYFVTQHENRNEKHFRSSKEKTNAQTFMADYKRQPLNYMYSKTTAILLVFQ